MSLRPIASPSSPIMMRSTSKTHIIGSSPSNSRRYFVVLAVTAIAVLIFALEGMFRADIYASTPFCDADGTCHEKPEKSSPRTIYSARSRSQYEQWWDYHATLNRTAESYARRREQMMRAEEESQARTRTRTRPLILLGDSITEGWLGTSMGMPVARARGVPDVLDELLSKAPAQILDPLVLAISGDQTQHLLYRLEHGQLLPSYADDPSTIFVVLIGTNNLGSGELPGPTSKGVLEVAEYLLAHSVGHLLLLQNLPRGDAFRLRSICPPNCDAHGEPLASFLPAIRELNKAVETGIDPLAERYGANRIGLIDCGSSFSSDTKSGVDVDLMPDLLHPNAAGHKLLGECFMGYIRGLEKG